MRADGADTGGYVRLAAYWNGKQRVVTVTLRADGKETWEVDVREDTTRGHFKLTSRESFDTFAEAINRAMVMLLADLPVIGAKESAA